MNKVIVIGIDGSSFDFIESWLKEGLLPNLSKAYNDGSRATLMSIFPTYSSVAWASFSTGMQAGKHGIFGFDIKRPNQYYNKNLISSDELKAEPIWNILERHGKRSIVVNMIPTYPPKKISGAMICGMMSPNNSTFTYPPELTDFVKGMGYKIHNEETNPILEDLILTTQKRAMAVRYLMQTTEWDFIAVLFNAVEVAHHNFFNSQEKLLKIYKALDDEIGKILNAAGKDVNVIYMSDHGHELCEGLFHPNNFLMKHGLLFLKDGGAMKMISRERLVHFSEKLGIKKTLKKVIPVKLEKQFGYSKTPSLYHVDWKKTKAYYTTHGKIYINLKGREPEGIVEPKDYDNVVDYIITELKKLDFVTHAFKRDDIFHGNQLDDAPDIVVMTKKYNFGDWNMNIYPEFTDMDPPLVGKHAVNGIFMAYGPDIKNMDIGEKSILDVSPTILELMGFPVPEDMDGKPIHEIINK